MKIARQKTLEEQKKSFQRMREKNNDEIIN